MKSITSEEEVEAQGQVKDRRLCEDKELFEHMKARGPITAMEYDRANLANKMLGYLKEVVRTNQSIN